MNLKLPLTVIILVRNEEDNISDCIDSCSFASEVLIIDDNSSDRTIEIAQKKGNFVRILHRSMNGDWGAQQTFGINQARNDWILFLDADERISTELKNNIISIFPSIDNCCYWVQRKNYFNSEQVSHGILRPDWVARLMPTKGSRVEGLVHPKIICPYENRRLKGYLLHHPYKSWDHYFSKFNKYTKLSAEKYFASGRRCSFFRDIILRPLWAFLKVYFINKGFLDGKYGLVFSIYHYFYTMTKYVRLYELQSKAKRN